jgi:phosphoserine phosphatase
MARTCTVCKNPRRPEIDAALLAGVAFRNIAKQFGLSTGTVFRHRRHVGQALAKAEKANEIARGNALVARLNELAADARRIKTQAELIGDLRTALAGVRELTRLVEVAAELSREQSLPLDVAQELFGGMARLVKEHVRDREALRAIASGFQELIERIDRRVAQV